MTQISGGSRFTSRAGILTLGLLAGAVAACSKNTVTSPAAGTATLSLTTGGSQSGVVGNALGDPVVVNVADESGKPLSGVAVTFSPASGDGTPSATQVSTDQYGNAFVYWTLGTVAGTDSMTITAGSLTPVAVVALGTPDVPAALVIVQGNDQMAPVDSPLASPLELKVMDQYGNVVPNAPVQWSDDANGDLAASMTTTNSSGVVIVNYTLGPATGPEDVTATLLDASTPTSVSFTEIAQ